MKTACLFWGVALVVAAGIAGCGGNDTAGTPGATTGSASVSPTPAAITSTPVTPNQTAPLAAGVHCGTERWPVKTLSDADVSSINTTPQDTTLHALRELPAPASKPQDRRVAPTELTTFKLTAVAMLSKIEDDRDIHLVIANPDNPAETMIVEFPNVACSGAAESVYRDAIKLARDQFVGLFGEPGSAFRELQTVVEITGVGFFDFLHGQTGVASNGVELHPIFSITSVGAVAPIILPATGVPAPTVAPVQGKCDPSYPTVCIPPPPPDLNCKDVPYRKFQVLPPDPHHFDGDHDGIGCES